MARTHDRGYGRSHRLERERWRPLVEAGECDCWRCGAWIDPTQPWDLGHDDDDRTQYRGPEHIRCNRGAGAVRGGYARHRPRCWCGDRCRLHVPVDQL